MKINFHIQKSDSRLYCRIKKDGKVIKTFATPFQVAKHAWNSKLQYVSEHQEANDYIRDCQDAAKKAKSVQEFFRFIDSEEYNIPLSELGMIYLRQKDSTLAKSTMVKYRALINIFKGPLNDLDIGIYGINKKYGFDLYGRLLRRMNSRSAAKRVQQVSAWLNLAVDLEMIPANKLLGLKLKPKRKELVYLTQEELDQIKEKQLIGRLAEVRDIFVFQCYTACEYSRAMDLTPDNLFIGVDGNRWLRTIRPKTDKVATLPLLPEAAAIVDKYKTDERLLPYRPNQKLNEYLKEIQAICGIEKSLHTHLSRHTFACTVCLLRKVPGETVAAMMGITYNQLMSTYGEIVPSRIADDMARFLQGDRESHSRSL